MTKTEYDIIQLYKAIEQAETRKEVKHILRQIRALQQAQEHQ